MRFALTLLLLLASTLVLAGCSYTPARIKPEPIIEIGEGDHRRADGHAHGGGFCPPGQAKKGRC